MKAFILAAGLGTRLKPLTDDKPKALVKLNGKPMLEHVIQNLKKAGINNFVINVHHFADKIETFLKEKNFFDCDIKISDERAKLLDTGGALLHAEKLLSDCDNFIIHNTDILSDININKLVKHHKKNNALATLAVHKKKSSRKLGFNKDKELCIWKNFNTGETKTAKKECKDPEFYAFTGIHILNKTVFNNITEKGKFSVIDLYLRLAAEHKIKAFEAKYNYWFDLGKPETLKEAESYIKNMQL
ncbi:MAG: nucleotidyltransferase family protein [Chlorobi bacterium]|nr:nucleotidyltransferase family protein [Chlorobiota bacterium]